MAAVRKDSSMAALVVLLISTMMLTFSIHPVVGSETIYIRADGSIDPLTAPIQRNGDTYTLTADINDQIVVERDNIVIDGIGHTLQGALTNQSKGVDLSERKNVTVRNIQVENFDYGIYLDYSTYSNLTGNSLTYNVYGIYLDHSVNNSISRNTFTHDGLCVVGDSYLNSVEGNTINGKPLIYLEGLTGHNVSDAGQVVLVDCNRVRIEALNVIGTTIGVLLLRTSNSIISGNSLRYNVYGIYLDHSDNNSINGNVVENNEDGLFLTDSSNNTILRNNLENNRVRGLSLYMNSHYNNIINNSLASNLYGISIYWTSFYNTITENTIRSNHCGVDMHFFCSDNTFFHNNLIDNNYQVTSDITPNTWDNGCEGNFWNDYNSTDSDGDGVGDTPYVIDSSNQDNCPLMSPYMPGDINHDGKINILDIVKIATVFGANSASPEWNPHCDLKEDGKINILDLVIVAIHFGEHWTNP